MRYFIIFLLFSSVTHVSAQKNVFLKIYPKVNGTDLVLGDDYLDQQGVAFSLDYFNYYLSGLSITHDGGQVLDLSDTVFIVKANDFNLYLGYLNVVSIESLTFSIGVPPAINTVSGANAIDISLYPQDHPLSFQDPSMYWGWTAGYMFLVCAGNADSDADGITDAYFELHNLGNHNYPQTSLPVTQTNVGNDQVDVYLDCNIEQWFKNVPLETISILHGTDSFNASSMSNVETEPVFTQPSTASILHDKLIGEGLYYSEGTIYWKGYPINCRLKVYDLLGKEMMNLSHLSSEGHVDLDLLKNGWYLVSVSDEHGERIRSMKFRY